MFVKFMRDGRVSIFEGEAAHIEQPKVRIGQGVREVSPHPKEEDGFDDTRIITLERGEKESLRFIISMEEMRDAQLWVFIMNDRGETIDKITGY